MIHPEPRESRIQETKSEIEYTCLTKITKIAERNKKCKEEFTKLNKSSRKRFY